MDEFGQKGRRNKKNEIKRIKNCNSSYARAIMYHTTKVTHSESGMFVLHTYSLYLHAPLIFTAFYVFRYYS